MSTFAHPQVGEKGLLREKKTINYTVSKFCFFMGYFYGVFSQDFAICNYLCNLKNLLFVLRPYSVWWRRQWHPTPVFLLGKSHGQRSLGGYSPWGRAESDMTEQLHFHFHTLEKEMGNPRDGLAWWVAVYGVAQSQTRLKWLSSSSSSVWIQGFYLASLCLFFPMH